MSHVRRSSLKSTLNDSTTIHKVKFKETDEATNDHVKTIPEQISSPSNGSIQLLTRRHSVLSCPPGQPLASRSGNTFHQKRRLSLPTLGTEQSSSFNHRCQPVVNKNTKPQQKYAEVNISGEVKPVLPSLITTGPSTKRITHSAGLTKNHKDIDSRSFCDSVSTIACSNISSTSSEEFGVSSTIIPLSLSSYAGKNGRNQIEDWLQMLKMQK